MRSPLAKLALGVVVCTGLVLLSQEWQRTHHLIQLPSAYSMPAHAVTEGAHHVLLGIPIDINHADALTWQVFPGVGPKLAERIVQHRRRIGAFHAVHDLLSVRGIGPAIFARMQPHLRVSAIDI